MRALPGEGYSVMRALHDKADWYFERERELKAPHGTIPVGGASFHEWCCGEALMCFLRHLQTDEPLEAAARAKKDAAQMVRTWNERHPKEYQIHRWTGMADALIDDAYRKVIEAV